MSSIKLDEGCSEVYVGEEATGGLVVLGSGVLELLELDGGVLDQAGRLEQIVLVIETALQVATEQDHGGLSGSGERLQDAPVGVERLVGDQRVGLHLGQQVVGADQVMRFASAGQKPTGFPIALAKVRTFVLSPLREWPIAWSSPAFLGAGAVLMCPHDGAVDHGVSTVGIAAKCSKICCQALLLAKRENPT